MTITAQDVAKIAKLARVAVTEDEKEKIATELAVILKWIDQLNEVNTGGVSTVASVLEQPLPWREDKVTDGHQPHAILANAPEQNYNCFVVPKVIDQG